MLNFNVIYLFKSLVFSILTVNFNRTALDTNLCDRKVELVKIYDHVCEKFEESLQYELQRFSNNDRPGLTDRGIAAIYLFVIQHQGTFRIKQIHRYAKDHLIDWFPRPGSYQAFNNRLNDPCGVMDALVGRLPEGFRPSDCHRPHGHHHLLGQAPGQGRQGDHRQGPLLHQGGSITTG